MAYCYAKISEGAPSIEGTLGTILAARLSGDKTGATIDSAYLTRCIADAEAIVNGYCAKEYTVPFDTVDPATAPEVVSQITLDIAIYKAYENRGAGATVNVRQRYEDALKMLEDISKGKLILDVTDAEAVPSVGPKTGMTVKERLFYR